MVPINKRASCLKALVVEDQPDFALMLSDILTDEGYVVDIAMDGVVAMERVRDRRPDVITLDIQMPRKGGVQFYRELKSNPEFNGIPVVVITGITRDDKDMENFVRTLLEVEHLPMPDAYLEKPVDNEDLLRVIQDALRLDPGEPDSSEVEEVGYALARALPTTDYDSAVERVKNLLAEEGFGVITEIDVKETLKKKLDLEFHRYVILGACNPAFAFQALTEEPIIGVLLPCNVVVMERAESGSTVVAFDPMAAFDLVGNSRIEPIGGEVDAALRRVLSRIESQGPQLVVSPQRRAQ